MFFVIFCLLFVCCSAKVTIYVSPFGSPGNSGLSPSAPVDSLTKAVSIGANNLAKAPVVIVATPGNYIISGSLTLNYNVTIMSANTQQDAVFAAPASNFNCLVVAGGATNNLNIQLVGVGLSNCQQALAITGGPSSGPTRVGIQGGTFTGNAIVATLAGSYAALDMAANFVGSRSTSTANQLVVATSNAYFNVTVGGMITGFDSGGTLIDMSGSSDTFLNIGGKINDCQAAVAVTTAATMVKVQNLVMNNVTGTSPLFNFASSTNDVRLSSFQYCRAPAIISTTGTGTTTIDSTNIDNCNGHAIQVTQGAHAVATNNQFSNNVAVNDGAVFDCNAAQLAVAFNLINNNTAAANPVGNCVSCAFTQKSNTVSGNLGKRTSASCF